MGGSPSYPQSATSQPPVDKVTWQPTTPQAAGGQPFDFNVLSRLGSGQASSGVGAPANGNQAYTGTVLGGNQGPVF